MIAKPVVVGRYWIVREGDEKVGSVVAAKDGYDVNIAGIKKKYKTISSIREVVDFEAAPENSSYTPMMVNGYPTTSEPFNAVYDVKHKLPLFTKEQHSKCVYAAGWYLVSMPTSPTWILCPKLLVLRRHQYSGPFKESKDI